MSKQTAVDFIVSKLSVTFQTMYIKEIEQAKEMEKQQLIDAHTKGYIIGGGNGDLYDCKQYYNETFNK